MIYSKEATFPYPVLINGLDDYEESSFALDVDLQDNTDEYRFSVDYEISSEFLQDLIRRNMADPILIIQSKDNKFYNLNREGKVIKVPKNRISLSKRTSIQLIIKAREEIDFSRNDDLVGFYDEIKGELKVGSHSVLGLSNVVAFDGSSKKPFELFEKKLDEGLKSDISIEIGEDTIIINYKSEDYQFSEFPSSNILNYPYIYMGLQKALYKLVVDNSDDGESIEVESMDIPTGGLNFKLYNLLRSKFIDEVNINNIDEVIYKISDKILEKYVRVVKGIASGGN